MLKKVALQPYICMGGPTHGLIHGHPCWDVRVAKRYASVTSTWQDASINEGLKHELYQKFAQKKKKIPCAKIWAPVQ